MKPKAKEIHFPIGKYNLARELQKFKDKKSSVAGEYIFEEAKNGKREHPN